MHTLDDQHALCSSCFPLHTGQDDTDASEPVVKHLANIPPASRSDLVQGKGSTQAQEFQRLYQDNLGPIYRYVFHQVWNREEAEDLTAHIFLKAVRSFDSERHPQSILHWLFRVARTTLADYWRAYYRSRAPTQSLEGLMEAGWEGPTTEDDAPVSSNPEDRVQRLLQALPERYRTVLTCRFLLAFSIKETAAHMGVTETNVKTLQFRALKRAAALEETIAWPLP